MKNIAYNEVYMHALSMKDPDSYKFKNDEEVDAYNEGYNVGKKDFEEENNNAYEYGYTKKEYSVPEKLVVVEKVLLASYNKGAETINAEEEKRARIIISVVVVLFTVGIASVTIIKKKQKSY